jgi:hypothetical protein
METDKQRPKPCQELVKIRVVKAVITLPIILAGLSGCGGSSAYQPPGPTPNPVPAINALSPSSASTGTAAFTLQVNGTNFVPASVVQWNGSSRTTSYGSVAQLTAAITAADIATAGIASVTVVNPSPGGGTSAAANFTINDPVPSITSLSPPSSVAGGSAFTLTLNGNDFISTSTVQWNGTTFPTLYGSATQLTAAIPAAATAFPGTANVTVANPAPGGGSSSAANFTISGTLAANARFVAPNGSDSNPGTFSLPYLTIQKCASTTVSGGTCAIRAGTYRETVTPNTGLTFTSYDAEPVTVDGADPVTGWSLFQGSIYKASVILSAGDTNQVFVGNQMMTEARWPNGDDLFNVNWASAQAGTTISKLVDTNLPDINWTGAKVHTWSGTDPWDPQTGTVTASQSGQLTISLDSACYQAFICPTPGGYYFLFGILAALDSQREWFYDSTTSTMYFWAPGDVDPNTLDVRAKQRQFAFDLSGKSNVTIQNINIFASAIDSNASSANNILDGLNAQYVSHYTTLPDAPGRPTSFQFVHMTDSGLVINGSNNVLRNSVISYSAGNAVTLRGTNSTVRNNLIHHADYMGNFCSAISVAGTGHTVQNNTAHSNGRQAIFPNNIPDVSVPPSNNDISYNNLYNSMILSRDGGEIYVNLFSVTIDNDVTGTRIHHNWFHDTQSLVPGPASDFPLSGVYLDEDAGGFEVDQNVFWNNQNENFLIHGSSATPPDTLPNNNHFHNNSILDVNPGGNILLLDVATCGSTQVVDNIIFVPVKLQGTDPACTVANNSTTAPGATEMNASVKVGCDFSGCSSSGPPAVSGSSVGGSIAIPPRSVTVTAGLTATFSVTAAGSPTVSYQWLKNNVNINGATAATYTTAPATSADNGSTFTVMVSNSVGTATSSPATLTVN